MSKLVIKDEIRELHWGYVKREILPKLEGSIADVNDVNSKFSMLLKYCYENAEDIATCDYVKLKQHLHHIKEEVNINDIVESCDYTVNNKKKNRLLDIYDYESFSKLGRKNTQEWSPYIYVEKMNVRVCPYCNRHYITTINTDKRAYRADIDHFLPKSKYPFFAMSLGNWVPSCMPCNRSLKGQKIFKKEAPNPYEQDYNKLYDFSVDMNESLEVQRLYIQEKLKCFNDIKEMFALDEQYKYHIDLAQEFIDKSQKYPDDRIKDMMSLMGVEYSEREKAYLIGYPESVDKIDTEVLGKLKRDMAKFVGYIPKDSY